jgi:hypothetical protein
VLFALFEGVPELVTLEEPHHGVQFGVDVSSDGSRAFVPLRSPMGQLLSRGQRSINVELPTRPGRRDVIDVKRLRDALQQKSTTEVDDTGQRPIAQTGAGAFAIAVLNPPWRQRFEGTEDKAGEEPAAPAAFVSVTGRVRVNALRLAVADTYREI